MSNYVVAFKCHCRQQIDAQSKDRIVTEACGHSKCRKCFIKEEFGCVKCLLASKTCDDQHQHRPVADPMVQNVLQNNDIIQMEHVPPICKSAHVGMGTSSSKPKDIKVLEEVIIKPFIEIPSNGRDAFSFSRMKEFQKFEYPPHISWQTVNGKMEFECKICRKSFRSKSNRRYRLYCDETVEKPFGCSKCSKTFATKNHLEYHENRHKNIQHVCKECGRTFLSRVSLRKHSKTHTSDFKYICDHCDMKFYNKYELILHMYSHKKIPLPFKRDACEKRFSAKFKLNQHVETHKEIKPHCCQFCGKKFTRNSSLTIHMLTHSDSDTKYECSLCSKSFERQRSYDRHMKIKHGSTAFRCPLCDVRSGRKDNILRHIRNLHSDENFDEIIKKISKTVTRSNDPSETEPLSHNTKTANELQVKPVAANVCQYQSVIQFAARSQTPPPPNQVPAPMQLNGDECDKDVNIAANAIVSSNCDDHVDKRPQRPFAEELRIELSEPIECDPKISNMSIYRQLLSPYLRPPPNLDFRNGSREQEKHRGYLAPPNRLPIRKENVDIYRRILMRTTDHAHNETVIHNPSASVVQANNVESTNSKTESVVIHGHGQSSEYFSEMHWRKRTSQCFNQMEQ